MQCERKPLILSQPNGNRDYRRCKNKTIGLDYQSSDESEEEKKLDLPNKSPPSTTSSSDQAVWSVSYECIQDDNNSHTSPINEDKESSGFGSRYLNTTERSDCSMSAKNEIIDTRTGDETNEDIDVESVVCVPNGNSHVYSKRGDETTVLSGFQQFLFDPPLISTTDTGYLHEISTRLLFATVDWIQGLYCFQQLNINDRYNLILSNWHKCFIIGMAQSAAMFPVSQMLILAIAHREHESNRQKSSVLRWGTFLKLKDIVMNAVESPLEKEVYNYMKLVPLFDKSKNFSSLYVWRKQKQKTLSKLSEKLW